jgi:hypothetical protein
MHSNTTWAFTGTRRNALLMTLLVFAWWVLPRTRRARVMALRTMHACCAGA